jgi:hypothetical protein
VVTAVAVMQLVDAGLVDLDSPVADYVDDFRMLDPEYARITVRMLLSHAAGVPGTDYVDGRTAAPHTGYPEQMLAQLSRSHLKSTPGSLAVYCNDCFTLAGLVVERVSGMPFTEYVERHVLEPLGMSRSMYATAPLERGEYAPVIVDGVAEPFEYLNINAAGGLLSTPGDLARLAVALLGDGTSQGVEVLSAAAVAEMGRDQIVGTLEPVVVPAFRYGLGWDTVTDPGLAVIGARGWTKGGDTVDYHATFMLAPDDDLAVIITAAGQEVGSGMLGTLAQSILRSAISERDGAAAPPHVPAAPGPAEATAEQIAAIAGQYAGASLTRVKATPEGALTVDAFYSGEWLPSETFTMRSDGLFWRTTEPSRSLQTFSAWGRTYLVTQSPEPEGTFMETVIMGEKLAANGALRPAWRQRVGHTWVIVNERPDSLLWNADASLTLADPDGLGYVWASHAQGSTPLDPRESDDSARMFVQVPALGGRDMNDLQVFAQGGEEWLRLGAAIYRPVDTIPPLGDGEVRVEIGADAAAQWRSLADDTRLTATGSATWRAYTPAGLPIDVAADSDVLPAGTLVAVLGDAGESVTLHAESP